MNGHLDQLHEQVAVQRHGQSAYATDGKRSPGQREHDGRNALDLVQRLAFAAGKAEGYAEGHRAATMLGETPVKVIDRILARREVLPYHTPRQIAAETSEQVDWIVGGYVACQAVTEVDGKVKQAGKTTMLLHLSAAAMDGEPFLGQPTTRCKVIYVTEQQPGPFRQALQQAALLERDDELHVLYRRDVAHIPWAVLIKQIAADAVAGGYSVLVIDTIGKLAGIRNENDAGEWATAMAPLQDAAHDGLAVVLARHDRKSGGEVGESGRGSSQASGDVDIILSLRRPEGNQPKSRRVIESLSRYSETPEKVVVELTEEGYVLLGDEEAVSLADALRIVSALIGGSLGGNENGWTLDEVVSDTELPRTNVQRALRELDRRRELTTTGRGVRGDPKRFLIKEERVSALTTMLGAEWNTSPGEKGR